MYRFDDLEEGLRAPALHLAAALVRRWRAMETYAPHKSRDELWEEAEAVVCDPHYRERIAAAHARLQEAGDVPDVDPRDLPPGLRRLAPAGRLAAE
jgi:hypothetical protein